VLSCKYCKGIEPSYQSSAYHKIHIDSLGSRKVLRVENIGCPKYVDCSQKDMNIGSAFIINFCPNCGRDLRKVDNNDLSPQSSEMVKSEAIKEFSDRLKEKVLANDDMYCDDILQVVADIDETLEEMESENK